MGVFIFTFASLAEVVDRTETNLGGGGGGQAIQIVFQGRQAKKALFRHTEMNVH